MNGGGRGGWTAQQQKEPNVTAKEDFPDLPAATVKAAPTTATGGSATTGSEDRKEAQAPSATAAAKGKSWAEQMND